MEQAKDIPLSHYSYQQQIGKPTERLPRMPTLHSINTHVVVYSLIRIHLLIKNRSTLTLFSIIHSTTLGLTESLIQMEYITRDIYSMKSYPKKVDLELSCGQTGPFMKDSGQTEWQMALEE